MDETLTWLRDLRVSALYNDLDDPRYTYKVVGRWAVTQGYLTQGEVDTIARLGHRKEPYWNRHVYDLCIYLEEVYEQVREDRPLDPLPAPDDGAASRTQA